MANNNNLLFNAALNGALAGMNATRSPTSGTAGDYAVTVNAAKQFAVEVDSLIANDGLISGGGGVTLAASTAAITDAVCSKGGLLLAICTGLWIGKTAQSVTATDYAVIAAAAVAMYTQCIAQQTAG